MTSFEYIQARDEALAIDDPVERRKAYRRVRWQREKGQLRADPERWAKRLAYVAQWKREHRRQN